MLLTLSSWYFSFLWMNLPVLIHTLPEAFFFFLNKSHTYDIKVGSVEQGPWSGIDPGILWSYDTWQLLCIYAFIFGPYGLEAFYTEWQYEWILCLQLGKKEKGAGTVTSRSTWRICLCQPLLHLLFFVCFFPLSLFLKMPTLLLSQIYLSGEMCIMKKISKSIQDSLSICVYGEDSVSCILQSTWRVQTALC